jgi:hypothetical protein
MTVEVVIYSSNEAQWVGEATLSGESAGENRALLRPSIELPPDHYVLRFPDGQRWAVETLSEPGRRLLMFGGRVLVIGDQPPPLEPYSPPLRGKSRPPGERRSGR